MTKMCKEKFTKSNDTKSSSIFGFLKSGGQKFIGNMMSSSFKTKASEFVKDILSGSAGPNKISLKTLTGNVQKKSPMSYQTIYGNFIINYNYKYLMWMEDL